jgi:vancomycin permeability regulator SanA
VLEAVREYKTGVAPVIILSGGAAHNRYVEADVMAQVAESAGVPRDAVFEERQARDTIENIEYSTRIMHAHGWDTVEAISSPSHLHRASLILMHSPIAVNWRMQAAAWPPSYDIGDKAERYGYEIYDCARMRIFGFKETTIPSAPDAHLNP